MREMITLLKDMYYWGFRCEEKYKSDNNNFSHNEFFSRYP